MTELLSICSKKPFTSSSKIHNTLSIVFNALNYHISISTTIESLSRQAHESKHDESKRVDRWLSKRDMFFFFRFLPSRQKNTYKDARATCTTWMKVKLNLACVTSSSLRVGALLECSRYIHAYMSRSPSTITSSSVLRFICCARSLRAPSIPRGTIGLA